jgi:ethanolamine utilization protein EutN
MQLGRVVGQVVCTVKDRNLEGYRLFVVQGLDERLRPVGKPFVAVDGVRCAGPGDVVWVTQKRDAAIALGDKPPVDATIVGYLDEVATEETPGGPVRIVDRGPGGESKA